MRRILISVLLTLILAPLAHAQIINTIAGGGPDNLPATLANLSGPRDMVFDAAGNLYVVATSANRVFRIDTAGQLTVYAGNGIAGFAGDGGAATTAMLNGPLGLALDASGNLFVSDSNNFRVRRVDAVLGLITTVVGNGSTTFSGDGGQATNAGISVPWGLAVDSVGNLILAGQSHQRIRRVDAVTHVITTVAGNGTVCSASTAACGDGGPATSANLSSPTGLSLDSLGTIYFADSNDRRVRRVDAHTGVITTVAGNGVTCSSSTAACGDGGPATSANLTSVQGLDFDGLGNLYLGDGTVQRIRRVDTTSGTITTVAGTGVQGFGGDGGPATSAKLSAPINVRVDGAGNLFIADTNNNRLRRVDATSGIISTVAGNGTINFSGDGFPAVRAGLQGPLGPAVDGAGNTYFSDFSNFRIRRVDALTGVITTYAGNGLSGFSGDGGPATSATFNAPEGLGFDAAGNLYVADNNNQRIRRIDALTGIITTVAGNGLSGFGGDGGPATGPSVRLNFPQKAIASSAGDVYFSDFSNSRIRKVSGGILTTFAGTGSTSYNGDNIPATTANLNGPVGIALDSSGNLYIAEINGGRVRRVDTTGKITTVAGTGVSGYAGDGGAATAAQVNPWEITVDGAGNLYIAESGNQRLRRVDAATGIITTIAGTGVFGFAGDGGTATAARLANPRGIGTDSAGNVLVTDSGNNRLRRIIYPANRPPVANAGAPQSLSGAYSGGANVTLDGSASSDPDGDTLTYTWTGPFTGGTASGTVVTVFFPLGTSTATLTVNDGKGGSASATTTITITNSVTTLVLSPNPESVYGVGPGISIQVTGQIPGTPTGTVNVTVPGTTLCNCTLTNGQVSFGTGFVFPVGTTVVTAKYLGNGTFSPSSASVPFVVTSPVSTTTTVSTSAAQANVGQSITFTATAREASGSFGNVTGSVQFQLDGVNFGSAIGISGFASGTATISSSSIPIGNHTITAIYNGDANNLGGSGTVAQLIDNPISFPATALANGTVGTTYSASLAATGGTGSFTYSVATGALPPGLSGGANLSGTPKLSGTFAFTMRATDSLGGTALQAFEIVVTCGSSCSPPVISGPMLVTAVQPWQVAAGDFNGDGKIDLAVATGGNSISILLGNGAGGFTSAGSISSPSGARYLVAGDFNKDGKLDLVVAHTQNTPNAATYFPGNGDGTFGSSTSFTVDGNSTAVVAGDLNGDGNLDVVVSSFNGGTVRGFLGNGAGSFAAATSQITPFVVNDVMLGDFNRDGKLDVAVAVNASNSNGGGVWFFPGLGTGNFSGGTFFATGPAAALAVGDFNQDGKLDIAALIPGSNQVAILAGNGSGGFAALTPVSISAGAAHLATADLNGDGKLDLAVVYSSPSQLQIFLGDGTGAFALSNTLSTGGTGAARVLLADVNGDGRSDVIVSNSGSNNLAIFLDSCCTTISLASIAGSAAVGTPYSQTLAASGGFAPYNYAITAGAQPAGLSLSSGVLSGTPTAAGTYTFTVTATDANGCTGSQVYTLIVGKGTPLVTWNNPADITYGTALSGTQLNATANVPGSFSYNPSSGTILNAGPAQNLNVSFTPADTANYNTASATVVITVNRANASVTPNASIKTYGSADPAFTGTLTGFLTADGVTASYSRTAGETVAGGPYTISATLSPAGVLANYNITYITAAFTISRANASVTPNAASKMYGAADPSFSGTLTGFLAADSVTTSYGRTAGETVAGSPYTISATLNPAGVLANYNITYNTAAFAITQASASVTPNAASKTYGTADPAVTGALTGFLAADNVTATYSRTAGETVAGSPYTISATLNPASVLANYSITYNTAAFTISPAAASVTPYASGKLYGAADPVLSGTLTGFMPADNVTAAYSRTAGESAAGSPYVISATLSPATVMGNYVLTYNTAAFTISKANASVTPAAGSKTYGAPEPSLTGTLAGFMPADGVTATYSRTPGETLAGNPYAISATLGPAAALANYNITYNTAPFTISRAIASVTPNSAGKTYGAPEPILTGTLAGFMPADSVTATYSRMAGETVAGSPYAITATLAPAAALANYSVTYNTAPFTIAPAGLVATANNASRAYGAANPAFSGTLTGMVAGDGITVSFSSAATAASAVGTFPIVPTLSDPLGRLGNYSLTLNNGALTISRATLTVTANSASKVLDAANPPFTFTAAGLLNGDTLASIGLTPSCTSTAATTSPVGSYPITCTGPATTTNYTVNYVSGTLKVLYASGGSCGGDTGHQILQPVNADGTSVWKQGRTIPAKFRVCDANGVSVGTPGVVTGFYLTQIISGTVTNVDETVSSTTPDTSFRWDASGLQWIFNISSSNLPANQTYSYTITLNDGSTIVFQYGLR